MFAFIIKSYGIFIFLEQTFFHALFNTRFFSPQRTGVNEGYAEKALRKLLFLFAVKADHDLFENFPVTDNRTVVITVKEGSAAGFYLTITKLIIKGRHHSQGRSHYHDAFPAIEPVHFHFFEF
jgi:hypothetical protein